MKAIKRIRAIKMIYNDITTRMPECATDHIYRENRIEVNKEIETKGVKEGKNREKSKYKID